MADKTPSSSGVFDEHYRNLADEYDEFLHYSDDFVRTLTAKMIDHLDLGEEDRQADIGCGTGIYSLDILELVDLKQPILGVDPYPGDARRHPRWGQHRSDRYHCARVLPGGSRL